MHILSNNVTLAIFSVFFLEELTSMDQISSTVMIADSCQKVVKMKHFHEENAMDKFCLRIFSQFV